MSLAYYIQRLRQQYQLEHLQKLQEQRTSSSNADGGPKFSQSCQIYPHQAAEFQHILKGEIPSSSQLASIEISTPNPPSSQQPASPSTIVPNFYSDFHRLQLDQTLSEQPRRDSSVEPLQQVKTPETPDIVSQQELPLVRRSPLHVKPYFASGSEPVHVASEQGTSSHVTSKKKLKSSETQAMITRYHEHQPIGQKCLESNTDRTAKKIEWSSTLGSEVTLESGPRIREIELSSEGGSRNSCSTDAQAQASYHSQTVSEIGPSIKPRSSIQLSTTVANSIISTPVSTNAFAPFFQNAGIHQPLLSPSPFLPGFHLNPNFGSIDKIPDPASVIAHALVLSRGNQKKRGEKKPIPNDLKDGRYYERRKRNNAAAKKSRDARKAREREVASKATILETENSCLRNEVQRLRAQVDLIANDLISQGYPILSLLKLTGLSNVSSLSSISNVPSLSNLSNVSLSSINTLPSLSNLGNMASLNAYANLSNINMKNLSITNDEL